MPPLSDGTWAARQKPKYKASIEYAGVAQSVRDDLAVEETLWAKDFLFELQESEAKALNAVFNGMLYAEEMIKERKLHHPLDGKMSVP